MHRQSKCTNAFIADFGPISYEKYQHYQGPNQQLAREQRIAWMESKEKVQMPLGPYPLHVRGMGWITMWLNDSDCIVMYTRRGDYNLDAYFLKVEGPPRQDSEDWIQVELRQESYDVYAKKFVMHEDFYAKKLSRKRPTQFISNYPVTCMGPFVLDVTFCRQCSQEGPSRRGKKLGPLRASSERSKRQGPATARTERDCKNCTVTTKGPAITCGTETFP